MSGGLFITRKTLPYSIAKPSGFTLMSDCHVGGATTDHDAITADLKEARESGNRINLNGDIFDCILPKDVKRFRPDAVHPDLHGRSDVLDAQLEMGEQIFGPFAKYIDVIGMGNHESAVEKYHATDMVARLVRRLNKRGGDVKYGGYTGFIDYRFRRKGNNSVRLVIYYHHGGGGSSPVTKGMIDFNRKAVWVDSDVVWLGHKHNKITDTTPLRMRCPIHGDEAAFNQQVFVMTGGYIDPYKTQTHDNVMEHGRKANYSSDAGLGPQAKGGAQVFVKWRGGSGIERIRVLS
jgi:hypothetical protein